MVEAVNGPSAAARLYKFAGLLGLLDSAGDNDTAGLVPWIQQAEEHENQGHPQLAALRALSQLPAVERFPSFPPKTEIVLCIATTHTRRNGW